MRGPISVQFVDGIDANPAVRLDLSWAAQSGLYVDESVSFPPPPVTYETSRSALAEGERVGGSQYGNRTITLPLVFMAGTPDTASPVYRSLHRELDRRRNTLRVRVGTSAPYFFRTFRAPSYEHQLREGITLGRLGLEIPAEPFALGLRQDLQPITVPNNPSSAGGCQFDVTGVAGDVDTPALMRLTTTAGPTTGQFVIAGRRRANMVLSYVVEAEAGALGTGAALLSDAGMSGGSCVRVGFTTASHVTRLTLPWPGAAPREEHKGLFNLFARVRKTVATDVITVSASSGSGVSNTVTLPAATGPMVVQLTGQIAVGGAAPDFIGYSSQGFVPESQVSLLAGRSAGSGSLDIDYVAMCPADDQTTLLSWSGLPGSAVKHLDGPQGRTYAGSADLLTVPTARLSSVLIGRQGGLPSLSPGVTNRFVLLGSRTATSDVLTDSSGVAVSYWPRFLSPF